MSVLTVLFVSAAVATGPQGSSPAGLPAPWQARETIQRLRARVSKVNGALGQLQVPAWQGTGASNYVAIANATRRQVGAIAVALDHLAARPDHLSAVIHLFLALQQVEPNLDSLAKAAARFQGPEAARALEDAINGLLNAREALVQYTLELAEFLEKNRAASQAELESCRQQLLKRPSDARTRR